MSLGNAFPANFAKAQIRRQLKPGMVIKLKAVMDDGLLHEKRFIVLNVSDDTLTCVINTRISPLISRNASAARCQVSVEAATHPFMDWDSHADCSRIRTYPTTSVISQLCDEPAWILGEITSDLRDDVVAALKASVTASPAVTRMCCESLLSIGLDN